MNIASFAVVFVMSFWLILFMLLPLNIQREENPDEGHDPGAPVRHGVKLKMLISGGVAVAFTIIYYILFDELGLSII